VGSRKPITLKIEPVVAFGEHLSERSTIEAWSAANGHIKRIENEAMQVKMAADAKVAQLTQELQDIKSSRSYRLARGMGNIKNKLKGQK